MKYTKLFAWAALAGGMAFAGASSAKAQDWRELFRDRNHIRQDSYRLEAMEQHVAADRARLDEDIRCGRSDAAARDAADLARDQRVLAAQRSDLRYDRGDLRNDYYRSNAYEWRRSYDRDRDWR